jgi:hypothetical protein
MFDSSSSALILFSFVVALFPLPAVIDGSCCFKSQTITLQLLCDRDRRPWSWMVHFVDCPVQCPSSRKCPWIQDKRVPFVCGSRGKQLCFTLGNIEVPCEVPWCNATIRCGQEDLKKWVADSVNTISLHSRNGPHPTLAAS